MSKELNPWVKKDSRVVYDNPWINLTEYDVITPAGTEGIYGKVRRYLWQSTF